MRTARPQRRETMRFPSLAPRLAMQAVSVAALADLLEPGMRVFVAGSSNEPRTLVAALGERPAAARGVTFLQFPLPGLNRTDFAALHAQANMVAFFLTPHLRDSYAMGRVQFVPMHMRDVFDYLRTERLDVALVQVARDAAGELRLGPNADFHDAVLSSASLVIAELNQALPAPAGAPRVDAAAIDYLIESDCGPVAFAAPAVDEAAAAIAGHVADLVRDGDCVQTGIGAIPAAILAALENKNDLGWHGGLLDDGGMALIERGVLTGAAKTYLPKRHVTAMALGSAELYDELARRSDVLLLGADVTHETRVIANIDNFVSINSAVEVDLRGQVNAEVVAGTQISGPGGAVDFMRGARMSKGGRSIVAMTATARGGTVSRIVKRVDLVTAPRTDVDMVVTEFGTAQLRGASEQARAQALIAIAHPDFRDQLGDELKEAE